MRHLPRCLTLCVLISIVAPATFAQQRISALIISGANNHDWEWTTPSLESILSESGLFDVRVTYEPSVTLADAAELEGVEVFVLDYNGPDWGEEARANCLSAVRSGVGVSVIHAADNAFKGWTEYETLVGDLWRAGTGHGRFHSFDVTISRRDHPITDTLPTLLAHPDELYHKLWRAPGANSEVLAAAHSAKESGGTGAAEPMILVGSFGEGRMFRTPLGHVWRGAGDSHASHLDPQFRNLVVRGTEWAATGRVTDGLETPNQIGAAEAPGGWRLLFDGETLDGWRGWNKDGVPDQGWDVVNGCLRHTQGGGDLITTDTFTDFELAFEWKVARGVNSGVKYRVPARKGGPLGPEYQILDDPGTTESGNPLSAAAALYAMIPTGDRRLTHAGAFNQSRILCRGNHIEHWLNGTLVLTAEVGSEDWEARRARSKFSKDADFATAQPGHVLLQDHGGEVWYRSIRLRELDTPGTQEISLLSGEGLEGWRVVGVATYRREGDTIVGSVGDGLKGNAFLCTEQEFGDFVFDVDLKVEAVGNSGIQFRSHQKDNGVVFGYQAEIDCSKRAWSGGIYDESRRGWLDNLEDDPAAQAAFQLEGWNHYRIEAVGEHLRVWVNGVLTADLMDSGDSEGFIALQVHGGSSGTFRWRDPRVRILDR